MKDKKELIVAIVGMLFVLVLVIIICDTILMAMGKPPVAILHIGK